LTLGDFFHAQVHISSVPIAWNDGNANVRERTKITALLPKRPTSLYSNSFLSDSLRAFENKKKDAPRAERNHFLNNLQGRKEKKIIMRDNALKTTRVAQPRI
jgi:hypothetical protein